MVSCDDHLIVPKNLVIRACTTEGLVNLSSDLLENPENVDPSRCYLINLSVMCMIPQDVREYVKVYCNKCSML
jgi:hypothetical protein